MPEITLAIDPESLQLTGAERRGFTAGEFAAMEPPPCPVCGTPVIIDRIDVTENAEDEAANGRTYVPGMWRCPHDCDPRAGQRVHLNCTYGFDAGGAWFECSCGETGSGLRGEDFKSALAIHRPDVTWSVTRLGEVPE